MTVLDKKGGIISRFLWAKNHANRLCEGINK